MLDNKAQISAELIIILAALLAVAVIFIGGLNSFSGKASERLEKESERAIQKQVDIGE